MTKSLVSTEQRLNAVEHRIDADMRCGRHLELVAELDGLVSRNPLRERLRGQLMLALYRSGRQGEALEAYQSGRRALVEELGIDPGPELRRLQDAILAHDPTLAPPPRSVAVRPAPGVRRGRLAVTLGGVLLVLAAAAAAAVELTSGGSSAAFAGVPGDHVGAIDPATNTLVQEVPVGRTTTTIVVGAGAVWALNADARTISRIDPATGAVQSSNTGSTPAGIAAVPGGLWVSYPSETPDGRVRLQHIEPVTFAVGRAVALPGRGLSSGDVPLVVAGGALWAIDPQYQLDRVDLRTGRVRVAARNVGPPIAAGLGAVWTGAQGANGTTVIVRVDARTAATRRVQTPILQLEGLAVGAGAVWATDEATGSLWRIQATRPPVLESVHVGLGAGAVAVGGGAVWGGRAGSTVPCRGSTSTRRAWSAWSRPVDTPQGIAYGDGRVWVSVAGGGGGALAGGVTVTNGAIAALPQDVCGPVFFAGRGSPKYLIASDLPFGLEAAQTRPMEEAIKFVLREHRFRAGRFSIGYQSCDDSTAEAGGWTAGKCQANAWSFASTPSVVGVIGTYNSGCAEEEIPITNRASLAMVSPANSYVGLTRAGPGVRPNDPAALYPAGRRTYARVYPPDDAQARAQVVLARGLARKRVFVLRDSGPGDYGGSLAASFEQAAHSAGITVVGNVRWAPSTRTNPGQATAADLRQATLLSRRIRASGARAVDLCGLYESFGGPVIDRLRSTLGHSVVFMADDAFLADPPPPALVRAEPLYVTSGGISDPSHQLPAAGRAFVSAFRGTQPARTQDIFYVYAAQAADVLLQAIALGRVATKRRVAPSEDQGE